MRGRERFKRYRRMIMAIATFLGFFPKGLQEKVFIGAKNIKGTFGLVLRYCLLHNLAEMCGDNVSIHPDVYLMHPSKLRIGNNVSIHPMCYMDACGGIEIGNDVSIAHGVSIISANHNYQCLDKPIKDQGLIYAKITIEDNVWIGAKATILSGVIVGTGAVIGAGAVVTHSVEQNMLAVGVPAEAIKRREIKNEVAVLP